MTDVLVVIPCLNEEAHLPDLLGNLLRDTPEATIIVADGGSADRSRTIVEELAREHPGLHLLDNPARIQSAGVNLAVRRFGRNHRWLVRVDAHCGYPARYVAGLIDAAYQQNASSVVVPMVTTATGCFQKAAAAAQNSVLGNGGSAHRRITAGQFVDHGHHALFDLALFCRAGGYDETFSHNEDAELDQRLALLGGRIWLEPALALTYWPRRAPWPLFHQYRGYGRGRAMNLMRHSAPLKLRQALPILIVPAVIVALGGLALAVISAWTALLAAPAIAWACLCIGFGLVLGYKARSVCVAASGAAAMIMHFAWSLGFLGAFVSGRRPGSAPRAISFE